MRSPNRIARISDRGRIVADALDRLRVEPVDQADDDEVSDDE